MHDWFFVILTSSRPNFKFSVCVCAPFYTNSKDPHLAILKIIFYNLNGTNDWDYGILRELIFYY